MAVANLHETLLNYTLRKNAINLEITELLNQKTLATYSQADASGCKAKDEQAVRDYFKALYSEDADMKLQYKDYTMIPDFEEEMDKIAAKYQEELDALVAWEAEIDAQIKTDSAELEEINAYMESIKSMLQSNIQEDYNYGMNN